MTNRGTKVALPFQRGLGNRKIIRVPGQIPHLIIDDSKFNPSSWSVRPTDYQALNIQNEQRIADEERQQASDQIALLGNAETVYDQAVGNPQSMNAWKSTFASHGLDPEILTGQGVKLDETRRNLMGEIATLNPMSYPGRQVPSEDPMVDIERKRQEADFGQMFAKARAIASFQDLKNLSETLNKAKSGAGTDPFTKGMLGAQGRSAGNALGAKLYGDEINAPKKAMVDYRDKSWNARTSTAGPLRAAAQAKDPNYFFNLARGAVARGVGRPPTAPSYMDVRKYLTDNPILSDGSNFTSLEEVEKDAIIQDFQNRALDAARVSGDKGQLIFQARFLRSSQAQDAPAEGKSDTRKLLDKILGVK